MLSLLLLVSLVTPLKKGDIAPFDAVAFDTLSSQKLLYYLDSLNYISRKLTFYDIQIAYYDSSIIQYKKLVNKKDSIIQYYNDMNKTNLDKIKSIEKEKKIERLVFIVLLTLVLLKK